MYTLERKWVDREELSVSMIGLPDHLWSTENAETIGQTVGEGVVDVDRVFGTFENELAYNQDQKSWKGWGERLLTGSAASYPAMGLKLGCEKDLGWANRTTPGCPGKQES